MKKTAAFVLASVVILFFLVDPGFAALPRYEIIDLGTLGGGYSVANAINDTGQVVGALSASGPAFYWDSDNGVIGFYDLLPLDSGWKSLSFASDINNRGRLVGTGTTDRGEYHAFLMTPVPESVIEAEIDIDPDTLNLSSKGKWVTCYIWLPEDYDIADIDPNSVLLEDQIEAESLWVDEREQIAMARFNREELRGILHIGRAELTISGKLTNGNMFEGTDVIRAIDKGGGKSAK